MRRRDFIALVGAAAEWPAISHTANIKDAHRHAGNTDRILNREKTAEFCWLLRGPSWQAASVSQCFADTMLRIATLNAAHRPYRVKQVSYASNRSRRSPATAEAAMAAVVGYSHGEEGTGDENWN